MQEQIFIANRTILKLYGVMLLVLLLPLMVLSQSQDHTLILPMALGLLVSLIAIPFSLLKLAIGSEGIRQYPRFGFVANMATSTSFNIPYSNIKYMEVSKLGAFNARALSITTTDYKKYTINSMVYSDFDQIIAALKPHVVFDAHEVSVNVAGMEDIGDRVKYVLGAGVVLFLWGIVLEVLFMEYWHLSSENMFGWLKYSLPAGILLAYAYIRLDKKAHALQAALISGLLLGGSMNFVILQSNRIYTEFYGQTQFYTFKYVEEKPRGQKWLPPEAVKTHDGYFYVHPNWEVGYAKNVEVGKSYRIGIKKGLLNDWAFAPEAFKNANLLAEPVLTSK